MKVVGLHCGDRGVSTVAQNEKFDGKIEPSYGFEFLDVQLEPAVAVNADSLFTAACQTRSDSAGQPGSHGTKAWSIHDALSQLHTKRLHKNVTTRARTTWHQNVIRRYLFG